MLIIEVYGAKAQFRQIFDKVQRFLLDNKIKELSMTSFDNSPLDIRGDPHVLIKILYNYKALHAVRNEFKLILEEAMPGARVKFFYSRRVTLKEVPAKKS